ncbi:MAG: NAD(P)H-binding protein [Candidatus Omnitrophica bacterium]|nr:NAD(P)H-binding protein [Candidatus Omnitrophota bacterium]MDE2008628.1 NAD(P)H-binding protein [Candidatus Omnitrophota bacterium]MDE2214989.1 NAD(P)H-binding protein [Candidatus Omnitrophota bacterium]MDE2230928.1 NAD(P)H-binding protein [Candidatus Omnitrophota bacterium]
MKLLVIGATGRTGREVVLQGLERGNHVTAFVRSPEKAFERHKRLRVEKGDLTDEGQLIHCLRGHDQVPQSRGGPSPGRTFSFT